MEKISFKFHIIAVSLIIVLSVIVYSNTFHVPFHYDDRPVIVENPNIKDLSNISDILFHNPFRPVLSLSFALNYYFNGLNPFGYHLVNLIFHILNGILVYILILLALSKSCTGFETSSKIPFQISFFVSLIFSLHPIQTESVTYISSRSEVMCTSFYLLSIIFFLKFLKSAKVKILFYLGSLVSFLISLGIKEIAITLPVTLILFEYLFLSKKSQGDDLILKNRDTTKTLTGFLKGKWYHFFFLFIIPVIFIIRYLTLGAFGHPKFHRDLFYHFLTQSHVIINYIKLFFLPVNLTIDHVFPLFKTPFEASTVLAIVTVFFIIIFSFKNIKKLPLLSFSILWFFLTLSPTSLIPLEDSMSERWLYLPSVGFCLFLVVMIQTQIVGNKIGFLNLDRRGSLTPQFYLPEQPACRQAGNLLPIMEKRIFSVYLLFIIILLFSVQTYVRNIAWQSEYSLWEDALKKTHDKARPYLSLGYLKFKEGKYEEAIDYYKKSIEIFPTAEAYNNLAYTLTKYNPTNLNDSVAIKLLEKSILLKKENYKSYLNIGDIYLRKRDYGNAMINYKKALEINPKFSAAYWKIGTIYESQGRIKDAIERYKLAIKFDPVGTDALFSLGTLYLNTAQYVNAILTLEKLIGLLPNNADAYYNLGLCYYYIGDYPKSVELYQQSLKINPNKADVHNSMGISLLLMDEVDRAMEEYAAAIKIDPKFAQAYGNMGLVYKQMGEKDRAIAMLKEALKYDPNNQSTKENLKELGVK